MRQLLSRGALAALLLCACHMAHAAPAWRARSPGLDTLQTTLGELTSVYAVRVDLRAYRLRALAAEATSEAVVRGVKAQAETVAALARRAGAAVAVNGTFFDGQARPLGLLIDEGRALNPRRAADWGIFYVSAGRPHLVHTREFKDDQSADFAIQVGPRTVVGGRPVKLKRQVARRAALAITDDHHVVFLITAGAPVESNALAAFMARPFAEGGLGARQGVMVDGGPSAQLYGRAGAWSLDLPGGYPVPNAVAAVPRDLRKPEARPGGGAELQVLQGPCEIDAIKQAVLDGAEQLQRCYERSLHGGRSLRGALVLQWIIAAGGQVTEARAVTDTLHDPALTACMLRQLKRVPFPAVPPTDGAQRCTVQGRFSFE